MASRMKRYIFQPQVWRRKPALSISSISFSGWATPLEKFDFKTTVKGAVLKEEWTETFATDDGRVLTQFASQRRLVT